MHDAPATRCPHAASDLLPTQDHAAHVDRELRVDIGHRCVEEMARPRDRGAGYEELGRPTLPEPVDLFESGLDLDGIG